MPRLSPRAHTRIDAASAGLRLLLPPLLGLSPPTRRASLALAGVGVLLGSVTAYPYPLRGPRSESRRGHRQAERLRFLAFLALPWMTRTRCDWAYLLTVLGAYGATHLLTRWEAEPASPRQASTGRAISP